mmetsp:Transcript_24990/g.42492  ORF Transcript_24990/g.42492 Transcript_24990/m.42492 type:complete len:522 (+) Transcript_24990:45-1610(+)
MIFLNNPTYRRLLIAIAFISITIRNWDDKELLRAFRNASVSSTDNTSTSSIISDGPVTTVAYAISITSCSHKLNPFDPAAVLKRSIELNSWPKHPKSRYASEFYVFIKTSNAKQYNHIADRCGSLLSLAGWNIIPQEEQVYQGLIKEPPESILKNNIGNDGCCGDSELIKLATYKLPHDIAVHLDLDTLVTNPFDELYNVMHFPPDTEEGKRARQQLVEVVAPTDLNRRSSGHPSRGSVNGTTAQKLLSNIVVDAFYTKDYNMISPHKEGHVEHVGVQGGFLVVRPSMLTYLKLRDMVYSGEFYGGHGGKTTGWFKSGYGKHIWGSMTIQGLLGYYFDHVDREHSVELNRCRYNNIADNARVSSFSRNAKFPRGTLIDQARNASDPRYNYKDFKCRDGRANCDDVDCQRFPIEKTRLVHYTYCKSPLKCHECNFMETYKEVTCYAFIKEWFRVRSTLTGEDKPHMEDDAFSTNVQWMREDGTVDVHQGNCYKEYTMGFCQGNGRHNYVSMKHRNMSLLPDN